MLFGMVLGNIASTQANADYQRVQYKDKMLAVHSFFHDRCESDSTCVVSIASRRESETRNDQVVMHHLMEIFFDMQSGRTRYERTHALASQLAPLLFKGACGGTCKHWAWSSTWLNSHLSSPAA